MTPLLRLISRLIYTGGMIFGYYAGNTDLLLMCGFFLVWSELGDER